MTLAAGLIAFYGQVVNPEAGFMFFSALLIAIIAFYIISYPIESFKKRVKQLDKNIDDLANIRKEIAEIRKELDIYEKMSNISTRLSVLEERRKK